MPRTRVPEEPTQTYPEPPVRHPVIAKLSAEAHRRLRARAAQNRRSMTNELTLIVERELGTDQQYFPNPAVGPENYNIEGEDDGTGKMD